MGAIASQITSLMIVYSIVYSAADQRKHQSSASLAFVRGIHRGPVNCPHKWPVTRKMVPFDDVIMPDNLCPECTRTESIDISENSLCPHQTARLGLINAKYIERNILDQMEFVTSFVRNRMLSMHLKLKTGNGITRSRRSNDIYIYIYMCVCVYLCIHIYH